jgi:two-component system, OmpR family, heavy metal sensor histidine kinase CusS
VRGPRSLLGRLTIWYAASSFALILISTAVLYAALVSNLDREDEEFVADIVDIVRTLLREHPGDRAVLQQTIERDWSGRRYAEIFVRVVDETGRTMAATPGMPASLDVHAFPPPTPSDLVPGPGVEIRPGGTNWFLAVSASATAGPDPAARRMIQVALGQAPEEALLADYRRRLRWVLSLSLVACTAVGYAIAKRGVRPLAEIGETARRVHSSTLDSRIQTAGLPTEIATLADTFNAMLAGLEDSFTRLARFSTDIAHELRTPVNNFRGEAEVALRHSRTPEEYRTVLESLLEESVRLSRMIDSLLFVARAEHPEAQIAREMLNVSRELEIAREFYEAAAADAGVLLDLDAAADLWAPLDRTLWQRAIGNLISNALDHTPAGGRIRISAEREGTVLLVRVSDTGSGIPPEHLAHVFDRFYRVDPATRSGRLGLGLALVKGMVALHGGSVAIASEAGRGTEVTLRVPMAASAAESPAARAG